MELTAQNLIPIVASLSLTEVLINLLVCLTGLLLHYIKKCGIEKIGLLEYWTTHKKNSVASVAGVILTFAYTQVANTDAPLSLFFTIGFVCDSILNKAPRGKK